MKQPAVDNKQIQAMRLGGAKLAYVRDELEKFTQVGHTFAQIEEQAQKLIKAAGAKPNFSLVKGYHWATCIMKNDAVVHGIPGEQIVEDGDIISIDVGLLYDGYHLDTSTTFAVGTVPSTTTQFLAVGRKSLRHAIAQAVADNSVYDISAAMQKVVEKSGYQVVYQLTGHGIGKQLHGEPSIPCFAYPPDKRKKLYVGQTLAIEIMYTMGSNELIVDKDGWTYRTKDGSLSGMFEETVMVGKDQPEILTKQ